MSFHDDLLRAYRRCSNHRRQLELDQRCGCFSCLTIFHPDRIRNWIPDAQDETAICPYCNSDSVLGESSGFPITPEFLGAMKEFWRFQGRTGS